MLPFLINKLTTFVVTISKNYSRPETAVNTFGILQIEICRKIMLKGGKMF